MVDAKAVQSDGPMSPIVAFETGLTTALKVGAVLTHATGSVWAVEAPDNRDHIVVFQQSAGGDDNLTPRRSRDVVYIVKAISTDWDTAQSIDSAVDGILHNGAITVSGWTVYTARRETDINFQETAEDGTTYFHLGAIYRFRLSK